MDIYGLKLDIPVGFTAVIPKDFYMRSLLIFTKTFSHPPLFIETNINLNITIHIIAHDQLTRPCFTNIHWSI
jgi:hypothetical protein